MRKFIKRAKLPFFCAVLAAVVLAACLWVYPAANALTEREPEGYGGILRLWHIDSFEGGKGSRAAFLRNAAKEFSERTGVFILVTVHTAGSAEAALERGELPDMLSCGSEPFAAELAVPLEGYDFAPARAGGKTYGYPWCRGGYFLFGAEGCDAAETRPDNTVIGSGPGGAAAAYLSGLPQGEYAVYGASEAYTAFAGGKYSFLIGTQRDYWRLTSRELAFTAVPLTAFGDLWQYLFICAKDTGKYRGCIDFLAYLLSDEIQSTLSRIGMMSIRTSVYTDDGPLALAEAALPARSASAFLSEEGSAEFAGSAFLAVKGDKSGAKKLENFLV